MTATTGVIHVKRPLVEYDLHVENIPAELKRRRQWVNFDVEKLPGQQRLEKVPKIPGTDHNASHSDLETWRTFEEALADVESGRHDGLGFVFSSGDPYSGIDRDHWVRPDGTIDLPVWEEMQALNSYTEVSISGTGVHVIVRGTVPSTVKRDGGGLEIYSTTRFFTFTGNLVPNCPAEIQALRTH